MEEIKYYELVFSIDCFDGELKHLSSMCVLGYREPTIEEAKEFWKTDCENIGELIGIYELTKEEAYHDFDMEREDEFPIFGEVN